MEIVRVGPDDAPGTDGYTWGRARRLLLSRMFTGLPQEMFAEGLARVSGRSMALRSYQRMEDGTAAIPETLWESVDKLLDKFEADVLRMLREVDQVLQRRDVDPKDPGDTRVVVVTNHHNPWEMCVTAHAMQVQRALLPVSRDDIRSQEEFHAAQG